ncbi:MAG: hypothetical protein PHR30_07165 [Gallionellaceae bacterium]|nr:hypothetical protein [Gallionellaceae bacterium]
MSSRHLAFPFLALLLLLAYGLYRLGFAGGFMYDDALCFQGLKDVVNLGSALAFVAGGDTGPLGRPLSLATFLINAPSWPSSATEFLYFNTLLHLVNGLLVAWLVLIVAKLMPGKIEKPEWFAVLVAAIWMLHPAWAFLVLHAVQRMAILATTFVLSGLIAYLKARNRIATRPRLALMLMAISLGLGTVLAILAKENGALLPMFAATLEWLLRRAGITVLPADSHHPRIAQAWEYWAATLFWLPAVVLAIYLFQHWPGFNSMAGIRDFTGGQRLLTEARVLWQYLFNLILPRPMSFTPFFDYYVVSESILSPITTLFAVLGWMFVTGLAWCWRTRYPIFFFAMAWFLVGHSIESTVVQLEVYFEHRNYLPSLGFVILAVYSLWQLPQRLRAFRWIIAGAYMALLALVLGQVTSLWGNPDQAAVVWSDRHPLSARLAQFHANQLWRSGQRRMAADVIWEAHLLLPHDTGLAVQGAELACWFSKPDEYEKLIQELLPQLRSGNFSNQPSMSLPAMFNQLEPYGCPAQRSSHLQNILDALLANPKYQASSRTMSVLHYLKGRLYMRDGDFNSTLSHLLESARLERNLDLTLQISTIFASGGLYDEAFETLETAMDNAPKNPAIRASWQKRIEAQRLKLLKTIATKSPTAAPPLSGQR